MMPERQLRKVVIFLFLFWGICYAPVALSQNNPTTTPSWIEKIKFKPVIGLQLWTVYSIGEEVFDGNNSQYQTVDNRFDVMLRRSRLGFKVEPVANVQISVVGSMDAVGRDLLSATQGPSNNGSAPSFGLWNAIVQWKVIPKKEVLYLATGYLTPQFSREHITGALRVSSLEKSWSQNYIRRHLTGIGPGRAAGIHAGGFLSRTGFPLALTYDAGIFNPTFEAYNGNSSGILASPLLVGKITLHAGDPESTTYSLSHKVNTFGKRRGISLGYSLAHQGRTDLFIRNSARAIDLLFNWDALNVDGEWAWLHREGRVTATDRTTLHTSSQTGFIRMTYNISLKGQDVVEPVVMLMTFHGPMDLAAQAEALKLKSFAGQDHALDVGINYYPEPEIRISVHYTLQNGDAGDAVDGATFNNYLYQKDVGAIHRGDYLGLGVVFSY